MTLPQAEIVELAKKYKVPAEAKVQRRLERLERMKKFYQNRAPDAPGDQANLFYSFASALTYAAELIRMYRRLTAEIAKIAKDEGDDVQI